MPAGIANQQERQREQSALAEGGGQGDGQGPQQPNADTQEQADQELLLPAQRPLPPAESMKENRPKAQEQQARLLAIESADDALGPRKPNPREHHTKP